MLAPIDQGIRNVGGRPGAREGPHRLLEGLEREGLRPEDARVREVDAKNTTESLEADLEALSSAVEAALDEGRLPIVLGGDHGTTYATVRGAARALDEVGVAYLDVHLDVRGFRPEHTSGSSFRRLVEEDWLAAEVVRALGIQRPEDPEKGTETKASFAELEAWAQAQGLVRYGLEEVRADPEAVVREALSPGTSWCFSIDTDALDQRWAPGVSAPGEDRLSLDEARRACRAARGRYRVLDIVEYSPPLDEDERTLETCLELLRAALPEPT